MAPKRRGARAAPTAKRGRAGDSRRLEANADAGADAVIEPPLAVANHPQRLVHFHREDHKVFVELTTLWRWLSGNLKSTKGDERLAKTASFHLQRSRQRRLSGPSDRPDIITTIRPHRTLKCHSDAQGAPRHSHLHFPLGGAARHVVIQPLGQHPDDIRRLVPYILRYHQDSHTLTYMKIH